LEVLRVRATAGEYGLQRDDFQPNNPDDYTLMNSHPAAKWLAQDERSTPRMSEVETQENLQRLRNQFQLVNARVVVGLGRPVDDARLSQKGKDSAAMRAIRCLAPAYPQITFLVSGHPSPRAINRFGGGNAFDWFERTLSTLPIENPQD
jgi:uracil-DNA glycosylase